MWKGRIVKRLWYWNVKIANSMLGEFIVKYQNLALRILYYYIILIISAKFIWSKAYNIHDICRTQNVYCIKQFDKTICKIIQGLNTSYGYWILTNPKHQIRLIIDTRPNMTLIKQKIHCKIDNGFVKLTFHIFHNYSLYTVFSNISMVYNMNIILIILKVTHAK